MGFIEEPGTGVLLVLSSDDEGSTSISRTEDEDVPGESPAPVPVPAPAPARQPNLVIDIPKSTLVNPKSSFFGVEPPLPPMRERAALAELMELVVAKEGFVEIDLDQFTIYVDSKYYPEEMRPLQHLATRQSHDTFYFDGIISIGSTRHYVRRVKFAELPIGNYGFDNETVKDQIWIRSALNAGSEIYYRLKNPAAEYTRFYTPFLWLADFAKHVIDFCGWMIENKRPVTIMSFKEEFGLRLRKVHKSLSFQKWYQQHKGDDFRVSLTANVGFVWKEAYSVLGAKQADYLVVFHEIKHLARYKPERKPANQLPLIEGVPPTVVTPYIMQCFGHMKQGKFLRLVGADAQKVASTIAPTHPESIHDTFTPTSTPPTRTSTPAPSSAHHQAMIERIKVGDTISTPPDGEATGTKWRKVVAKGSVEDDRWFGLVQKVHVSEKTRTRSFDVTWLYRPVDTPCCRMKYPWDRELFLSDHCTCEDGRDARVDADEVLATHSVDWSGNPEDSKSEFFVRQTYLIEKRRWVALDKSNHLRCRHGQETPAFREGDTVLATAPFLGQYLEPFEIVKIFRQGSTLFVRLRRLLRRSMVDKQTRDVRPNELVYTEQLVVLKLKQVAGKCVVRVFRPDESIPDPYNRNGTGNVFFITHRLEERDGQKRCIPFGNDFPTSLRQGFDPRRQSFKKLRGLDLFCGGGNFGRGLEDGGIVEMRWACDLWDKAIHTYMANVPDTNKMHPFLGSTDDLLQRAIEGDFSKTVPRPGEVEFISAGSPCPGFSLLTVDKTTPQQQKNQSLVASFASFVDFYRPKYGILENVPSIVPAAKNRTEDVFSQLICSIVGMGYQTQLILGDAWSYGSPQGRSRVFLYFAAPDVRLPEAPMPSHSHFPGAPTRSLGEMSNGEPYVCRSTDPTAFKFVSIAEGTADLPPLYDSKPDCCVQFPDHRVSVGVTNLIRHQIGAIPNRPYGLNFVKAWNQGKGVMTAGERELFPHDKSSRVQLVSKGWGRIRPNSVLQTLTTSCGITDARHGTHTHWFEPRPISIMEARRAQGFLDHEVLVGDLPARWKIIGNSVARQVAVALGLQFREAWLGTLYDDATAPSVTTTTTATATVAVEETKVDIIIIDDEEQDKPEPKLEPDREPDLVNDEAALLLLYPSESDADSSSRATSTSGTATTPGTSASETPEASASASTSAPSSSKKRPLFQSLVIDLHTSKMQRLQQGEKKPTVVRLLDFGEEYEDEDEDEEEDSM